MIFLSINDKDFNGCILPSFHGICGFSSYTNSEYTDFIAKDTVKYSRQIKLISISGIVFQISLCLVFIFVNSISYIASRHSVFLLFIFILCFSIILHLFMFFNRRNTNTIESQSDLFLYHNPEKFSNIHPYKDDSIKK